MSLYFLDGMLKQTTVGGFKMKCTKFAAAGTILVEHPSAAVLKNLFNSLSCWFGALKIDGTKLSILELGIGEEWYP